MNKDEILAKSRAQQRDEMEIAINEKSAHIGILILFITCIFFVITRALNDGEQFFEFPAILFAYVSGINGYNFYKLKKQTYLVASVSFAFAFISMTILYFMNR